MAPRVGVYFFILKISKNIILSNILGNLLLFSAYRYIRKTKKQ